MFQELIVTEESLQFYSQKCRSLALNDTLEEISFERKHLWDSWYIMLNCSKYAQRKSRHQSTSFLCSLQSQCIFFCCTNFVQISILEEPSSLTIINVPTLCGLGGGTASEITYPLLIMQVDDLSEIGIGFQVPYTQMKLSSATVNRSKKPDLLASGDFHFPFMKSQLSDDFVQQQTNHPVEIIEKTRNLQVA